MVQVVDKTNERRKENKQGILERNLMIDCFKGKIINERPGGYTFYVLENEGNPPKILAEKLTGTLMMRVYDKSILEQAKDFGKKYEKEFIFDNFTIETNYS